jgi:hypothetical protein|tara:strand:+ start:245 stop:346 length:102 start_codon:yes stop_codon:yes gene_type:complete
MGFVGGFTQNYQNMMLIAPNTILDLFQMTWPSK